MSATGGIITYPGKVWADADEPLDNADLDAGAQPLFELQPDSVGTAEINAPAVLAKLTGSGGAGLRGGFTLGAAFTVAIGQNLAFGTSTLSGAKIGDLVEVTPLPALNLLIGANCLKQGVITLSAFNFTAASVPIPAATAFSILVFNL